MLWRKVDGVLEAWERDRTHQAILLEGARQVGKTTAVRAFARREGLDLAEVNFLANPRAVETVSGALSADDLMLRLSVLTGKTIDPSSTLLFLDEVQECSDLLTWVKFLIERSNLRIAISGSLLGVGASSRVRSLPVGFLQRVRVNPLNFEEFCRAEGLPPDAWALAADRARALEPVPGYLHERLMALFRLYVLVGGMPDAVQAHVDSPQAGPFRNAQRAIFDLYEDDIAKYVEDPPEARQIQMVFESIPGQLNAPSKRFKYARLGRNLRFANMETAFDWLSAAGVAIEATRVGEPSFPLLLSEDRSSLKLFMGDVGLLTSRLMGEVELDVLNGRADVNYGSVFENAVAQELVALGLRPHYYYSKRNGEVDFVTEDPSSGEVTLLEVKSGKGYKRHSALSNLLRSEAGRGEPPRALVLCDGNVESRGDRAYVPVYAVSALLGRRA